MAKPAVRLQALEVALLAGLALVVLRAGQVQLLQGNRYAEEARSRRTERIVLQARRGGLYDRNGVAIALTQETYHVGVAANELRDPTRSRGHRRALRLPPRSCGRLRKRYAYFGARLDLRAEDP
jgi:cell division protein FtsI/penicillin-binding protein 2